MAAIKQIESSGNPLAFNKGSGARGLYQITPICLKEWNNFHKDDRHSLEDLFIPAVNRKIAVWYLAVRLPQMLRHYGKEVIIDNILWGYNAGIGYVVKNIKPTETRDYIKKYERLTK
jgi:soluble lytic murein transglycosylase-like protein